ncbi:MAG: hypothetical protein ACJA0M_002308 [Chitinophagales bacterium]|mgnify:FL=1
MSIFVQTNAYAQSDWDCDKSDANWNCAEKSTKQKQSEETQTNEQEETSGSGASAANEESEYQKTLADNNTALDPLARPSKFPADAHSIQLLASSSKEKIIGLIKQYRIPSLIVEYTTAEQTLYLWIAGTYYSDVDTQMALDQLPTLPPNISLWVRPANTIADMPVLVRARL